MRAAVVLFPGLNAEAETVRTLQLAGAEVALRCGALAKVALVYCARDGALTGADNPRGSARNIAGIYGGETNNVLGLMPHPERMSEDCQGGEDGLALFSAVVCQRHAAA